VSIGFFRVLEVSFFSYAIVCFVLYFFWLYFAWFSEDAVSLSGVRCTFWSLRESLKLGGFVNTFVVSYFCYSLFSKPNGHPDFSKRHYFFFQYWCKFILLILFFCLLVVYGFYLFILALIMFLFRIICYSILIKLTRFYWCGLFEGLLRLDLCINPIWYNLFYYLLYFFFVLLIFF
jgi:hypothetical protein